MKPAFEFAQPVEVAPTYKYAFDWRGQVLWISRIYYDVGERGIRYEVAEQWPPTCYGHLTDGWRAEDLQPRLEIIQNAS